MSHVTRKPLSRSKGQRSTCRGRVHIVAASRTACYSQNQLYALGPTELHSSKRAPWTYRVCLVEFRPISSVGVSGLHVG